MGEITENFKRLSNKEFTEYLVNIGLFEFNPEDERLIKLSKEFKSECIQAFIQLSEKGFKLESWKKIDVEDKIGSMHMLALFRMYKKLDEEEIDLLMNIVMEYTPWKVDNLMDMHKKFGGDFKKYGSKTKR